MCIAETIPGGENASLRLLMLGILALRKGQVSACFNTEGLHGKSKGLQEAQEVPFLLVLDKDIAHAMCLGYQTSCTPHLHVSTRKAKKG